MAIVYFCVTNYPQDLGAQNNKDLLSHSFCGSRIWAKLSWVPCFRLKLRYWQGLNWGKICIQIQSIWEVSEDVLLSSPRWLLACPGLHRLLARNISSLPPGPFHSAAHTWQIVFPEWGLIKRKSKSRRQF